MPESLQGLSDLVTKAGNFLVVVYLEFSVQQKDTHKKRGEAKYNPLFPIEFLKKIKKRAGLLDE